MSTITRRFTLTTSRDTRDGQETLVLGRGVEFEGKDLSIEVHALPVGNWWAGVAKLSDAAAERTDPSAAGRRFDLVAGKRRAGEQRTIWIKVGTGLELGDGAITVDFQHIPAGNWWDGRLRLFEQRADSERPRRGLPRNAGQ